MVDPCGDFWPIIICLNFSVAIFRFAQLLHQNILTPSLHDVCDARATLFFRPMPRRFQQRERLGRHNAIHRARNEQYSPAPSAFRAVIRFDCALEREIAHDYPGSPVLPRPVKL